MIKQKLSQKNWRIRCRFEHEIDLLLEACERAGITWVSGKKATSWKPSLRQADFVTILWREDYHGIIFDYSDYGERYFHDYKENARHARTDLTQWFFDAIKNDNTRKLSELKIGESFILNKTIYTLCKLPNDEIMCLKLLTGELDTIQNIFSRTGKKEDLRTLFDTEVMTVKIKIPKSDKMAVTIV